MSISMFKLVIPGIVGFYYRLDIFTSEVCLHKPNYVFVSLTSGVAPEVRPFSRGIIYPFSLEESLS